MPVGDVISDLARRGLGPVAQGQIRNGIRLFPVSPGAGTVTPEIVRELLDKEP